jgi:hypothetical protein
MPYKDPDKQREYNRLRNAKRRAKWLHENGPCVKCGSWYQLEVDHINRKDKITNAVWSWSEARRNAELAKCQILCKECHKKKTTLERFPVLVHGTVRGYKTHNCRCLPCKQANARYEHGRRTNYARQPLAKSILDMGAVPIGSTNNLTGPN